MANPSELPLPDRLVGDDGAVADPSGGDGPGATAAASSLLRGLNEHQEAAVTSPSSPLRILAGAGSGKTRVLTHRIAHRAEVGTLDPTRVLAVTFTRKAAGELRDRLGRLGLRDGVHAGTFHAIAYAQLRQRWEERGIAPPELLDRKVGFVARLIPGRSDRTTPLDVTAEIEWAAARRITPERYEPEAAKARRRPPVPLATVATVYDRYVEQKRRRRLVDFDDILRLAARDLEADPVYAAARRWRFRHLFVDEFQDVNPLQFHLLQQWLGPDSDVCIVGDPNQAIYAWNGADARYLVDFDHFFPGGETVTLEDNYRSTPQILAVANGVLQRGSNVPIRLRPHRPAGEVPTVRAHADDVAEARAVARACRDGHRPGVPWSAQAVLVRTNAQTTLLTEAMTSAGVPHRVRGAGRLLEQPEVTEALQVVRRAPSLDVALADLDHDVVGGDRLTEERAANVAEVVRLGREFLALEPSGDAPAFLAWLTTTLRDEDRGGGDAVDIVTFHAAKGLEWSVVHVAGLEEGYVPIHHAETTDDVDEERRLLYVALTRARDELHCTWARKRTFGSRSMNRSPSPWVESIETTLGVAPTQVSRSKGAERARAARKAIPKAGVPTSGPEKVLFEALRAWRRDQSRAADVPAFVIFNDATLGAIAERRPRSQSQLLDVPGVGPVKAQRFGADVLRIVAESAG
ncbi:ATP-dependent helicase [Dermatobacter hominis]|uniref:ATP-dependent helicase n=1 Tax=Dermatobacter hominis TaxID=2884263 RepID=UPI001D10BEA8|nr:ATP-dependent DNA helicase UvrD2 [Dermatobacter hominis]UDY36918.1 ATP-dependent DNA helicase UvrD2 [Dermatobacter hominis]